MKELAVVLWTTAGFAVLIFCLATGSLHPDMTVCVILGGMVWLSTLGMAAASHRARQLEGELRSRAALDDARAQELAKRMMP